jgi:signal peptidase I
VKAKVVKLLVIRSFVFYRLYFSFMLTALNKSLTFLFWSVLIWLAVRTFIFQIVQIPSNSMNQTFREGDRILINKFAYGARIPMTPLSFSVISNSFFLDWIKLPYFRLSGYSNVKNNDILVFNFPLTTETPIDKKKEYVKRCIAIPGDTLTCIQGIIYINEEALAEKASIQFHYRLQSERHGIKEQLLTKGTADSINKAGLLLATRKTIDTAAYNPSVFPNTSSIKWNIDNFGPLYIPKKGDTIALTKKNIFLYQRIIEQYEHNVLRVAADSVYINNQHTEQYTFQMNYYFVMGDNRYHSIDSRSWGFVPEDHLIGKISFLLPSL